MNFILFLIVNAILFLRPAELVSDLAALPLYQIAILACLACSIVPIMRLFMTSPLHLHPTFILVGVMVTITAATLFSNKGFNENSVTDLLDYLKVIVYFVLFLALVDTPARLRALTVVITLCVLVTATISILHYKEIISIPKLEVLENVTLPSGEEIQQRRLRFSGMLQDPNEVAVFLAMLIFLCAYQWQNRAAGAVRQLWLVPMGVFLGAIAFTSSRGGFLALLIGVVAFAVYRFQGKTLVQVAPGMAVEVYKPGGSKRAAGFVLLLLPFMLLLFGGRQTEFDASKGTGNDRIGLWSDWLYIFRSEPFLGVSPDISPATDDSGEGTSRLNNLNVTHLAHNSYLQAFADLGFLGGLCFLGAFALGISTLNRYAFGKTTILDPEQKRLHPYLCASMIAYMAGMASLTINYYITTAFVLALPVSYYGMTAAYPVVKPPALDSRGLFRLCLLSVGVLGAIYGVTRVFRSY
jgi:O-antigen ligase